MTDRERLIDILERTGSMRQFPGTMARILTENGVTFVKDTNVLGRVPEEAFRNGEEHMREKVIELIHKERSTAIGNERIMLGDLVEKIKKIM